MRDMEGIAPMSASGSGGPSPDPKLSSAPGPPSRSALARSRDRAASILPASVPAIRYAGLMPEELSGRVDALIIYCGGFAASTDTGSRVYSAARRAQPGFPPGDLRARAGLGRR